MRAVHHDNGRYAEKMRAATRRTQKRNGSVRASPASLQIAERFGAPHETHSKSRSLVGAPMSDQCETQGESPGYSDRSTWHNPDPDDQTLERLRAICMPYP